MTIKQLKKIIADLPDDMQVVGGEGLSESEAFVQIVSRAEVIEVDDNPALYLSFEDAPDEDDDEQKP